jgi:hypothetical protein
MNYLADQLSRLRRREVMTLFDALGSFRELRIAYRTTKPARVVPTAQMKRPSLLINSLPRREKIGVMRREASKLSEANRPHPFGATNLTKVPITRLNSASSSGKLAARRAPAAPHSTVTLGFGADDAGIGLFRSLPVEASEGRLD